MSNRIAVTDYAMGRLRVRVAGHGAMHEEVRRELSCLPMNPHSAGATVHINFNSQIGHATHYQYYKPVKVFDNGTVQVPGLRFSYSINADGGDWVMDVAEGRWAHRGARSVRTKINRWRDWNYLTHAARAAKDFHYNAFDYAAQMAQISLRQSFIHAGAVERDGRALVIAGWGGVGKTTAMMKMVLEHDWRYLSDDLAIIDDSGRVYRSPKRLQIYGYNVMGEPSLRRRLLQGCSLADRWSWEHKIKKSGPNGVRRRVTAERFLGVENVAYDGLIDRVVLLSRGDVHTAKHVELSAIDLAARATSTLVHELSPLASVLAAYHASRTGNNRRTIPTLEFVIEHTKAILLSALDDADLEEIILPQEAGPREVIDAIEHSKNWGI